MDKIKELFVVQYWGQKVYKPETVSDPMEVNSGDMGSGYLLLRSVGQLTDEEKIQLCHVSYLTTVGSLPSNDGDLAEERHIKTGNWLASDIKLIPLAATDYLRSIGILLPFTYLDENNKPFTIQPEEILKRGWAKYQGICKH